MKSPCRPDDGWPVGDSDDDRHRGLCCRHCVRAEQRGDDARRERRAEERAVEGEGEPGEGLVVGQRLAEARCDRTRHLQEVDGLERQTREREVRALEPARRARVRARHDRPEAIPEEWRLYQDVADVLRIKGHYNKRCAGSLDNVTTSCWRRVGNTVARISAH